MLPIFTILSGLLILTKGQAASRCGSSFADAASTCGTLCPNGVDSDCPSGQKCFGSVTCSQSTTTGGGSSSGDSGNSRCGSTFEDANTKCGSLCPNGLDGECAAGEHCFGGVTCTAGGSGGPESKH